MKPSLVEKVNLVRVTGLSEIGRLYLSFVFHKIVWGICLEQNKRVFEGKERTEY